MYQNFTESPQNVGRFARCVMSAFLEAARKVNQSFAYVQLLQQELEIEGSVSICSCHCRRKFITPRALSPVPRGFQCVLMHQLYQLSTVTVV